MKKRSLYNSYRGIAYSWFGVLAHCLRLSWPLCANLKYIMLTELHTNQYFFPYNYCYGSVTTTTHADQVKWLLTQLDRCVGKLLDIVAKPIIINFTYFFLFFAINSIFVTTHGFLTWSSSTSVQHKLGRVTTCSRRKRRQKPKVGRGRSYWAVFENSQRSMNFCSRDNPESLWA